MIRVQLIHPSLVEPFAVHVPAVPEVGSLIQFETLDGGVQGVVYKHFYLLSADGPPAIQVAVAPLSKCIECGCDELHPCESGCAFVSMSPPVCSNCIEAVKRKMALQQGTGLVVP